MVFGRKDLQKPDLLNARKLRTQFRYALLVEFCSNHAKNRVWGCRSPLVFLRFKNLEVVVSFGLETLKKHIPNSHCIHRCSWLPKL